MFLARVSAPLAVAQIDGAGGLVGTEIAGVMTHASTHFGTFRPRFAQARPDLPAIVALQTNEKHPKPVAQ